MSKAKGNPHCSVKGCSAKAAHADDSIVRSQMKAFAKSEALVALVHDAIGKLGLSILRDLEDKNYFAFQSRLRQPEELYIRTLYVLFIATPEELPHIFSSAMPNGFAKLYREVNREIFEGRGPLEVSQSGLNGDLFTPMDTLNQGAHVTFSSIFTAIGLEKNSDCAPSLERYSAYLKSFLTKLEYVHDMFKAGKPKEHVLGGLKAMYKPAAYWEAQSAKAKADAQIVADKS